MSHSIRRLLSFHSLRVGDDVAEHVLLRLPPAGFHVQLEFGEVRGPPERLLVDEGGGGRRHLLDPAPHLRHLLQRLGGVLLLHRHPRRAGPTPHVLQPGLPASGRLRCDVPRRGGGAEGGFVQVGEEFGEEDSSLRLKKDK